MRLSERVYLIGGGALGFGISHELDCHVYLIDGGREMALIDAGAGVTIEPIIRNLQLDGLDLGGLKGSCRVPPDRRRGKNQPGSCETWRFLSTGLHLSRLSGGAHFSGRRCFPCWRSGAEGDRNPGPLFGNAFVCFEGARPTVFIRW